MEEHARVLLTAAPDRAWLYHKGREIEGLRLLPELHTTELPSYDDMCVTHRPAPQCPCGVYEIHWLTAGEAA